jgi:hypothetical protein
LVAAYTKEMGVNEATSGKESGGGTTACPVDQGGDTELGKRVEKDLDKVSCYVTMMLP